jgi:hypothetical protein
MAEQVDARFARGWRGEGRSRATEIRAEELRGFMVRAWNVDDTTVHTLKGRTTDMDRVTHESV